MSELLRSRSVWFNGNPSLPSKSNLYEYPPVSEFTASPLSDLTVYLSMSGHLTGHLSVVVCTHSMDNSGSQIHVQRDSNIFSKGQVNPLILKHFQVQATPNTPLFGHLSFQYKGVGNTLLPSFVYKHNGYIILSLSAREYVFYSNLRCAHHSTFLSKPCDIKLCFDWLKVRWCDGFRLRHNQMLSHDKPSHKTDIVCIFHLACVILSGNMCQLWMIFLHFWSILRNVACQTLSALFLKDMCTLSHSVFILPRLEDIYIITANIL